MRQLFRTVLGPKPPCLQAQALGAILAVALCAAGCGQSASPPQASPAPASPPPPAATPSDVPAAAALPATSPGAPPANAPPADVQIQALAAKFKTAAPETQARIDEALRSYKSGNKREAITKLKLVDADSELTGDQQQSVKELITIIRQ